MQTFIDQILAHYAICWGTPNCVDSWDRGPVYELPSDFRIAVFEPRPSRKLWTYATCGMSEGLENQSIEIHLFSPVQERAHLELLTAIAHFHRTSERLKLGHTVNFGRPWLPHSACDIGLVSLPYLDGPKLEHFSLLDGMTTLRCLWLIPITRKERNFKGRAGLESLEKKFGDAKFNYADPGRKSVV